MAKLPLEVPKKRIIRGIQHPAFGKGRGAVTLRMPRKPGRGENRPATVSGLVKKKEPRGPVKRERLFEVCFHRERGKKSKTVQERKTSRRTETAKGEAKACPGKKGY